VDEGRQGQGAQALLKGRGAAQALVQEGPFHLPPMSCASACGTNPSMCHIIHPSVRVIAPTHPNPILTLTQAARKAQEALSKELGSANKQVRVVVWQ